MLQAWTDHILLWVKLVTFCFWCIIHKDELLHLLFNNCNFYDHHHTLLGRHFQCCWESNQNADHTQTHQSMILISVVILLKFSSFHWACSYTHQNRLIHLISLDFGDFCKALLAWLIAFLLIQFGIVTNGRTFCLFTPQFKIKLIPEWKVRRFYGDI